MNDSKPTGTDLHDGKRIGSRPRLSDMGIETLSRRPSRRDTIDANADEDQGSPHEQDNHTQQPNQPVNGALPRACENHLEMLIPHLIS